MLQGLGGETEEREEATEGCRSLHPHTALLSDKGEKGGDS